MLFLFQNADLTRSSRSDVEDGKGSIGWLHTHRHRWLKPLIIMPILLVSEQGACRGLVAVLLAMIGVSISMHGVPNEVPGDSLRNKPIIFAIMICHHLGWAIARMKRG